MTWGREIPCAEEIKDRWARFGDAREALLASAEGAVVTWRYAEPHSGQGELAPWYAERHEMPRGSLHSRPEQVPGWNDWHQAVALGFDAAGRLLVRRDTSDVRVALYGDGWVEQLCFGPGEDESILWPRSSPKLQRIIRGVEADGELAALYTYGGPSRGWSWERYRREGGRITEIRSNRDVTTVEWAEDGNVDSIVTTQADGTTWTRWQRPPSDLATTVAQVEDALVAAIDAFVRKHWSPSVFGLMIGHSGRGILPPTPVLLTRDGFRAEIENAAARGDDALVAWAPQDHDDAIWGDDLPLSPDIAMAVRILDQEWRMAADGTPDWDHVVRVARRVADIDRGDLEGGSDLIVYVGAFDDSGAAGAYMHETVPAERIAALQSAGWLPARLR